MPAAAGGGGGCGGSVGCSEQARAQQRSRAAPEAGNGGAEWAQQGRLGESLVRPRLAWMPGWWACGEMAATPATTPNMEPMKDVVNS